jgi:hypothetical protein
MPHFGELPADFWIEECRATLEADLQTQFVAG